MKKLKVFGSARVVGVFVLAGFVIIHRLYPIQKNELMNPTPEGLRRLLKYNSLLDLSDRYLKIVQQFNINHSTIHITPCLV